ncbi:cation:proton antiporter [Candidatus Omnitrophota bacterium]
MRRLRWLIGLLVFIAALAGVIYCAFPSVIEWQSPFLRRAFCVLFFSALFCLWRIIRGPTPADRAVAIDILGILILGFCAILGIATGRDWYIDIGIAWALQSFISTLALAKYLEGRNFDE